MSTLLPSFIVFLELKQAKFFGLFCLFLEKLKHFFSIFYILPA